LRINKDIAVSDDGKVAIVGWYDTTFFMLYSADFGETFTYLEANGRFELPSPMLPDGSYMFVDSNGTPSEIFAYPSGDGGHFNAFFNDNNQIIAFSAMGINTQENYDSGFYFPAYFYPKIYQFEIENNNLNVHVVDLHLEGAFPNDGIPVIPWDLNNDGIIDEVDENGTAIIPLAYPSHYFDGDFTDAFFHESNFRLTYNNNWVAAVWQDCEKVAMNYNEVPGYEGWEEKPEIMVAVSADYGITWSQPAYLNAKEGDENYFPELYAMTPAYVYPADKLEIIDSNHAKLHLFFMDDYKYGTSFMIPPNPGGMLYYASLSVEMPAPIIEVDSPNTALSFTDAYLFSNYPNPFNSSTTIQFELAEAGNVTLEIFNLKGQRVKQFKIHNSKFKINEVVWDGTDEQNQPVASGIYFYKLRSSKYSAYRKMILMK
jgi:hypothetical protein